jgi:hypothetical protein
VFTFVEIRNRFKFEMKPLSKPFENHYFPFMENILGFEIDFKFDVNSKILFSKEAPKSLISKILKI